MKISTFLSLEPTNKNYLTVAALCFFIPNSYAQVNAVITYTYEEEYMQYKYEYQLIINRQLSNFQNHREATEFTTDDGYFIEISKNYYNWYYDATTKKVVGQRVLKKGIKVIANWPEDLSWNITEETKEIG